MSILIKGMDMPKTCAVCKCSIFPTCLLTMEHVAYKKRREDCPLVEVPKHGRLIDADKLDEIADEYIEEYGWNVDDDGCHDPKWCAWWEAKAQIESAPTVIEAEVTP